MIRFGSLNLRGVVILEFAGVLVALAILGFLSLNYVNSHQKLASTATQADASTKPSVTANDIKPIVDTASLDDAAKQLTALQHELDSSNCLDTLNADIDAITN